MRWLSVSLSGFRSSLGLSIPAFGLVGLFLFIASNSVSIAAEVDNALQARSTVSMLDSSLQATARERAKLAAIMLLLANSGKQQQDECVGVICTSGSQCYLGACVPNQVDSCNGILCGIGEVCIEGSCYNDASCSGVLCSPGNECRGGACVPVSPNPCDGVVCATDQICYEGGCYAVDPCSEVSCSDDQVCIAGSCYDVDVCSGVLCPAGQSCQGGSCIPDQTDPCIGVICPDDYSCSQGGCFPNDPCIDVSCPDAHICYEGSCYLVDPCSGVICADGEICTEGSCYPEDPCSGVVCADGEICTEGSCYPEDPCSGVICADGEICTEGSCYPEDPCSGVFCPDGQVCDSGQCVEPNAPPVADAGADITMRQGEIVSLSGAGSSDSDGSIISYVWTLSGVLQGSAVDLDLSGYSVGTYEFTLTVRDNQGAESSDTVSVMINSASAPILLTDPSDSFLVTGITNLEIDGKFYDVQIHTGLSFVEIWDADNDWVFGEADSSLINHAPTFWGGSYEQGNTSLQAVQAISEALGSQYYVHASSKSDSVVVPDWYNGPSQFFGPRDSDGSLANDSTFVYSPSMNVNSTTIAFASFSPTAVPNAPMSLSQAPGDTHSDN